MVDARLLAASFSASDANFCISEVSSTVDDGGTDGRRTVELNDVVRRGGFGGLLAFAADAVKLTTDVTSGVEGTVR